MMKPQYSDRYKEDCAFGAIVVVVFAAKGLSVVCGRREKRNVIVCRGFCANTTAACSIFWDWILTPKCTGSTTIKCTK